MDNEIDKSLSLILENNQEVINEYSLEDVKSLFSGNLEKLKENSKKAFDKQLSDLISSLILSNPKLLQAITDNVMSNIEIKVNKK